MEPVLRIRPHIRLRFSQLHSLIKKYVSTIPGYSSYEEAASVVQEQLSMVHKIGLGEFLQAPLRIPQVKRKLCIQSHAFRIPCICFFCPDPGSICHNRTRHAPVSLLIFILCIRSFGSVFYAGRRLFCSCGRCGICLLRTAAAQDCRCHTHRSKKSLFFHFPPPFP